MVHDTHDSGKVHDKVGVLSRHLMFGKVGVKYLLTPRVSRLVVGIGGKVTKSL